MGSERRDSSPDRYESKMRSMKNISPAKSSPRFAGTGSAAGSSPHRNASSIKKYNTYTSDNSGDQKTDRYKNEDSESDLEVKRVTIREDPKPSETKKASTLTKQTKSNLTTRELITPDLEPKSE